MSDQTLYDDDILLWSEQQAELIRRLGRTRRDLPNDFDVENVAEEIESVGRSELAAVESQIENILVHLIKLAFEPQADARTHWRSEIVGFHNELLRRYVPSMHARIDLQKLWRAVRRRMLLIYPGNTLPVPTPLVLDDFLGDEIDDVRLAARLLVDASGG